MVSGAGVAGASVGGASAPGTPVLRDAICISGCVGLRKATVGGTVQASGRNMSSVTKISFPGRTRRILAPVTATTNTTAQAIVPRGAQRGKIRVRDGYGQASELSEQKLVIRPRSDLRSSGALQIVEAEVSPHKTYFFGVRKATLNYVIASSAGANNLRIDVVTPAGEVVKSFFPTGVLPNATNSVPWDGTGSDGRPVPSGWYSFRISGADGVPAARAHASQTLNLGVAVYGFIFPIRGAHDFGDAGARFGASRSGHTHQGQDTFADCGTKLVAARGGKVQYSGYQGAAGNYLVIDQKGSGEDNAYMHLQKPSPLSTGDRVRTGQYIGNVGDTGDASGCHLHFEVWTAPGWYEGGHPYDPLPLLKSWDKYS
jgi:hypothetical protein